MKRKITKEVLNQIIQEEYKNQIMEEGIVNWLLDKATNFVKGHFNHVADYQYARLLKSPEFKSLHKRFGMSEKDFMSKATKIVKENPKRFEQILAYDASKSRYSKFF